MIRPNGAGINGGLGKQFRRILNNNEQFPTIWKGTRVGKMKEQFRTISPGIFNRESACARPLLRRATNSELPERSTVLRLIGGVMRVRIVMVDHALWASWTFMRPKGRAPGAPGRCALPSERRSQPRKFSGLANSRHVPTLHHSYTAIYLSKNCVQ